MLATSPTSVRNWMFLQRKYGQATLWKQKANSHRYYWESEPIPDLGLHRSTLTYFSCSVFFSFDSCSSMKVVLSKRGNSSLAQQQNGILILHLIPGKNKIHLGGVGGVDWSLAWLASLEWLWLSYPILIWKRWCCSLNMYKLQSCRAPLCFKIICNTFFSRFGKKDHHISGESSFDEPEGGGLTLACEIFNGEQKLAYAPKKLEE